MGFARTTPASRDPDAIVWRYMDDWKFEDLLKRFSEHDRWQPAKVGTRTVHFNDPGQLWFGFSGSFGDSAEGTFPDPNEDPEKYCDRMAAHMGLSQDEAKDRKKRLLAADTKTIQDGIFFMAQLCGVSCWCANDSESKTMWNDFVAAKNGVAIRSTCGRVERSLKDARASPAKKASPSVCAVGYVDHANYFLPSDGFRGLLSIVQESWSHENEVRFVAKSPALAAIPTRISTALPSDPTKWSATIESVAAEKEKYLADITAQARKALAEHRQSGEEGFHLPIVLSDFMLEVVIKPGSTSEYETTVQDHLRVSGCAQVPVRRSSLGGVGP